MINRYTSNFLYAIAVVLCLAMHCLAQQNALQFPFNGKYGQVEVGGRYAGTEFHRSRPLPSRVSFYAPVANSIDLSTDYWKRDESRPFALGVQIGDGRKHWLGREGWEYVLSPHTVTFRSREGSVEYSIGYHFCLNNPAFVYTVAIKNISARPLRIAAYAHLKPAIRTCQTYARKDSAITSYDPEHRSLSFDYRSPDADSAVVFVENAGEDPFGWTSSAAEIAATDSGTSSWIDRTAPLGKKIFPDHKDAAVAAFEYQKDVAPGDSLFIVHVIGSALSGKVGEIVSVLRNGWKGDVDAYEQYVEEQAFRQSTFITGDTMIDRSVIWAKGILASNRHYIEGSIQPMPCPAEYNFYFTHDVLMTNLGAVNFDLDRVKNNLRFIAEHAGKDSVIPHAYYWRDDGFKTEFCTPENWNHLWFVLVVASYLRHSHDTAGASAWYPQATKSLAEILTQRKADDLMYAFRPDWWDIGRREGPRAYITILTIRALRDYVYLSAALGKYSSRLKEYDSMAGSMEQALAAKLWDGKLRYLINYNDSLEDTHYYMGSLLAPVYNVLDPEKSAALVRTAGTELLRYPVGVMVVTPPDFHTPAMRAFFKFVDNEAGDPYLYANGGIWPHANAWYAMALQAVGRTDEALTFTRDVMTVDGVAKSPNGLPAMYEYRMSDSSSKDFGKIDKPSFMWAGGFYLNVLYHLAGFAENAWNLALNGALPNAWKTISCSYTFGGLHNVSISGTPPRLRSLTVDGQGIPSLVLPLDREGEGKINVEYGAPKQPYLESINAVLHHAEFSSKKLTLDVSSCEDHETMARVIAPYAFTSVAIDGKKITAVNVTKMNDGMNAISIRFNGVNGKQRVEIIF